MLVSHCNIIYDHLVTIYPFPISRSLKPWFIPQVFSPCRMSETSFSRFAPRQSFLLTFDGDFVYVRIRDRNSYSYFKALIKDLFTFKEFVE